MAQGMMQSALRQVNLENRVRVDSAGIQAMKRQPPDGRAQRVVRQRGADLSALRSRQFERSDYTEHDLILCMDKDHAEALLRKCPQELCQKIQLIMDFSPRAKQSEVPDPYYGNIAGFEHVANLLEPAIQGVVEKVRADLSR